MTTREKKILKSVLQYLHDTDRGQRTEVQIHAGAFAHFDGGLPSVDELSFALRLANGMQLVRGVPARFGPMKWNITDAGEAALIELNEA